MWVIYALSDPRTSEIRYIGVTHRRPGARLNEHLSKAKRERNHRASWIRSLVKEGVRVALTVIESGVGDSWIIREQHWIAHYRSKGTRLTNTTDGGEGSLGWDPSVEQRAAIGMRTRAIHRGMRRSDETRQRMRDAQTLIREQERAQGIKRITPPRSEETLKRMSDAQKGKIASEETRRKLSESHLNPSDETRQKLREATLRRPVEERRAWAENQKGVAKSEEHRRKIGEARRRAWAIKKEQA